MGLTGSFPDSFLEKMSKPNRPKGKAGKTLVELAKEKEEKSERELHGQFSAFLHRHEFKVVIHDDPRKPTRLPPGWPDFYMFHKGKSLWIEFKILPNKLTEQQEIYINIILEAGGTVAVCYTLEQATNLTKRFFDL